MKFFPVVYLSLIHLNVSLAQSLPPLLVTGDKLASKIGQTSGNGILFDDDFLSTLPPSSATYQDLFSVIAGGYSGNPTAGSFSLRGLNQDNVLGYVGTGSNSLIAVIEDGAPLSSNVLRYLPPVLWNLRGVEVLRGPQSLSQGPNSLGGALLLHTRPPGFDHSGSALIEFAEYNTFCAAIDQSLTLIPEELALGFSYHHQESDGQTTNRFFNDDEFGATSRDRYQARLFWHPGKNPANTIELSLVHDQSDGNPFATTTSSPGVDFFDRETSLNTPSSYPAQRSAAILNATFSLPDDLELRSNSAIQRFDLEQSFDLDATPFLSWFVNGSTDETRFTQDFNLIRRQDDYQWLLGAYFERSNYDVGFSGRGLAPFPVGSNFANAASEAVMIAALYGRLDWEFMEKFHLTGGLRINHEDRELDSTAQFGPFPEGQSSGDTTTSDLLPQIGISWRPEENKSIGLQVTRGYRGGGVSYAPTLGISQSYDPEYAWEAELFARIAPTDSFQLSTAVFHSWLEDQQVPLQVPGGFPNIDTLIANSASSRRYGMEIEASWEPLDSLNFHSSLGYIHTEFRTLDINGVDRSGQAFPNAPQWTASIGGDYHHSSGFFTSANFSWSDTAYTFVNSPDLTALESRSLLSARIGYQWPHTSLYLFGSNLLDDSYALMRADNSSLGLPVSGKVAPPRMLGIGCEARW